MPELLDKSDVMRIINSENVVLLCCTRLRSADEVLFSIESKINSLQTIQTTIEADIDRAAILRLCNEIEDIACDISQQTMNDIVSAESRMIFDKAKEIAAEITAPPKTNADRIRQMTDEELSDFLGGIADNCSYNTCESCPMYGACVDVPISRDKWLKQEVSEDARTD